MLHRQIFMVASKRVALILFIFLVVMGSIGESTRIMKGRVFESLLENRLPRGPVPPSGPSLCHNNLNPSSESKFSNFPADEDIICP